MERESSTYVALVRFLSEDARDHDGPLCVVGLGDGSERSVDDGSVHLPPELDESSSSVPFLLSPGRKQKKRRDVSASNSNFRRPREGKGRLTMQSPS